MQRQFWLLFLLSGIGGLGCFSEAGNAGDATGGSASTTGGDGTGTTGSQTATATQGGDSSGATSTSTTDTGVDSTAGSTGAPPEGCGNGVMEDGEGCDDGNTASGDGCSAACQDETSYCDPRVVGSYSNADPLSYVAEAGDIVVVSTDELNPAVVLLDITDPEEPLFQDAYTLNAVSIVDLIGRSDRVFAVGDPLVTAFSVSNGSLALADQIDGSSEFGFQAALQGTGLYIADDSTSRVVNVANLGALNLTSGNLNLPGVMFPSYDGVAAAPGRAYISGGGMLGVFDLGDPFDPTLQGTVSLNGSGRLRVTDDENHVVSRTSDGFGLYDVTDGSQPAEVATGTVPQGNIAVRDVVTHGTFVYALTSNGKVFVSDIGTPSSPVDAGEVDIGAGAATAAHAGQSYVLVIQDGDLHLVADLPGYCDAVCGNGAVEYPEMCDDGDLESGDDCDVDCTL